MMEFITQDFKNRIEAKVSELEKQTSVEFVSVITKRSSDYSNIRREYALTFLILSLIYKIVFPSHNPVFLDLLITGLGAVAVYGLVSIDAVLFLVLPRKTRYLVIEAQAHRAFQSEEVFATQERTGVLVMVSLFERGVFVLGDKGLDKKITAQEWAALGQRLAADFNRKQPGETFFAALDLLIERLRKDFPPSSEKANELSNRLRIE